jgi:steroid delta-isomerase-like uncharacterized protein
MGSNSGNDVKALVRRYVEELYNQGNAEAAGEFVTDDYVNHAGFQTVKGVDGIQQFVHMLRQTFPDWHETILDQVVEGDREVHRYVIRGTHEGEFMGIPATGKEVVVTGITIARLENGKIAEEWSQVDMFGAMQQMGVVPA